MMRDACEAALRHQNVIALLRVIRAGETGQTDDAYRTQFGGHRFDAPPWQHPRQAVTAGGYTSTAAGAYQFLSNTWDECQRALGLPDFSPACQDLAAVYLIQRRGAIGTIQAGDLEAAVRACGSIWASLPGSPYGQPTIPMARCREVYAEYGGTFAADAAPAAQASAGDAQAEPTPQPTSAPADAPTAPPVQPARPVQPEKRMPILALLSAFGPLLGQLIPQIAKIVNPQGEVAQRNLGIAEAVVNTVVQASGQPNVQAAVEAMQADPELTKQVTEAVVTSPTLMQWLEVGGGITEARKADAVATQAEHGFWWSPVFWISVLLLPLVYLVVYRVLWADPPFSDEMRVMVVTAIATGLLGSITGYFMGSAMGSQRKDDTINALTKR